MKFPIFSSDKEHENKNFQSNYVKNTIKNIDNNEFPLPVYKAEAIKELDNAVVIVLHRMKAISECPLFTTMAINKKELKDLIKSIMDEDDESGIYYYSKLYDESYDKIVSILQYRDLLANTTTAKFDDIGYILYSVDIGVEGYIGTSLAIDMDYMNHDSYFMKCKLHNFEKELLSKYGPGTIQVDDIDICKKHDNSRYIRISCTYKKEDKEDDKSINSNNV